MNYKNVINNNRCNNKLKLNKKLEKKLEIRDKGKELEIRDKEKKKKLDETKGLENKLKKKFKKKLDNEPLILLKNKRFYNDNIKDLDKQIVSSETNTRNFCDWFVGYIEGLIFFQSIFPFEILPPSFYNPFRSFSDTIMGKPDFRFCIKSKDIMLLWKIKNILGIGIVKPIKNSSIEEYEYSISEPTHIRFIIHLLKERTVFDLTKKKLNEFIIIFENWNNSYNNIDTFFYKEKIRFVNKFENRLKRLETSKKKNKKKKLELELELENAWFSGLIDSSGTFYTCYDWSLQSWVVAFKLEKKVCKFNNIIHNFELFLDIFGGIVIKKDKYTCSYYLYGNYPNIYIFINYLTQYPLKSKKSIIFKKWLKTYIRLTNVNHVLDNNVKSGRAAQRFLNLVHGLNDITEDINIHLKKGLEENKETIEGNKERL